MYSTVPLRAVGRGGEEGEGGGEGGEWGSYGQRGWRGETDARAEGCCRSGLDWSGDGVDGHAGGAVRDILAKRARRVPLKGTERYDTVKGSSLSRVENSTPPSKK